MGVSFRPEDIGRETVSRLRSRLHSRSLPPQRQGYPVLCAAQGVSPRFSAAAYIPSTECTEYILIQKREDTPVQHRYILLKEHRIYTWAVHSDIPAQRPQAKGNKLQGGIQPYERDAMPRRPVAPWSRGPCPCPLAPLAALSFPCWVSLFWRDRAGQYHSILHDQRVMTNCNSQLQ